MQVLNGLGEPAPLRFQIFIALQECSRSAERRSRRQPVLPPGGYSPKPAFEPGLVCGNGAVALVETGQ